MTGRETAGIFKTWKEKNQESKKDMEGKKMESLRPGRKKSRNL